MACKETVLSFIDDAGRSIEIDHLGMAYPESWGEFAIYHGDDQIGEFIVRREIERAENHGCGEMPDDAELIAQAKLVLHNEPCVLT